MTSFGLFLIQNLMTVTAVHIMLYAPATNVVPHYYPSV